MGCFFFPFQPVFSLTGLDALVVIKMGGGQAFCFNRGPRFVVGFYILGRVYAEHLVYS